MPREGGRALVLPGSCDPRALPPLPLLYPRRRPLPPSGARAPLSTRSPNCINAPHARAQSPLARAPAKARKGSRRDGRSSPSVDWHANGVDRLFVRGACAARDLDDDLARSSLPRPPAHQHTRHALIQRQLCLPACLLSTRPNPPDPGAATLPQARRMVFAALRLWLLPSLPPPVIPHVSLFAATGRRASVWWDAGASGPRSPSLRAQTVDPPCRSPHPENLGLGTAKPALLRAGLAALITKRFHAELGQVTCITDF